MCLDTPSYVASAPKTPDGAGFTVANVDKGTSKYTKVYEGDKDVTEDVELNSATNKYRKRPPPTTNEAIDNYAGA